MSNVVSIADIALERGIFEFAALFWQNPVASMVCLLSLMGLTIVMWFEVTQRPAAKPQKIQAKVKPMVLRR